MEYLIIPWLGIVTIVLLRILYRLNRFRSDVNGPNANTIEGWCGGNREKHVEKCEEIESDMDGITRNLALVRDYLGVEKKYIHATESSVKLIKKKKGK